MVLDVAGVLAFAPRWVEQLAARHDALHDEISADYTDMIYAKTAKEIETRANGD
jgi:hypothetical protein